VPEREIRARRNDVAKNAMIPLACVNLGKTDEKRLAFVLRAGYLAGVGGKGPPMETRGST
jgi:hypothetical protein